MLGHYAVADTAVEHSESLGDRVLVGTAEVRVHDVGKTTLGSAVFVAALPGRAEKQQSERIVFAYSQIGADSEIVALHGGAAVLDNFAVEVAAAEPKIMTGSVEVAVPPIQVDLHAVVEDMQVVAAVLTPLHTGRGRREPLVES
ncbi:hypothetical protein RN2511_047930 [Rhodococcus sp. NKCM2511]|nr:hypothetical protein RN2511_047930 [Rhodococcus sp. NKCM2511]